MTVDCSNTSESVQMNVAIVGNNNIINLSCNTLILLYYLYIYRYIEIDKNSYLSRCIYIYIGERQTIYYQLTVAPGFMILIHGQR